MAKITEVQSVLTSLLSVLPPNCSGASLNWTSPDDVQHSLCLNVNGGTTNITYSAYKPTVTLETVPAPSFANA